MTFHLNVVFNSSLYFSSKQNKGKKNLHVHCSTYWSEFPWQKFFPGSILDVKHGCHRQKMVREKNSSRRWEKSQGISPQVGEDLSHWKKSRKSEILRLCEGLICAIGNSAGQRNFTFVRKKSGKSQGISETSGCRNHVKVPLVNLVALYGIRLLYLVVTWE